MWHLIWTKKGVIERLRKPLQGNPAKRPTLCKQGLAGLASECAILKMGAGVRNESRAKPF
jgi:hypothetical protein